MHALDCDLAQLLTHLFHSYSIIIFKQQDNSQQSDEEKDQCVPWDQLPLVLAGHTNPRDLGGTG